MSQPTPRPAAIPIPPNFPVQWQDPGDAQLFWTQAQGYYPTPITPLGFELIAKTTIEAANRRMVELAIPLLATSRHFNGYVYIAILPPDPGQGPPRDISQEELNSMIAGLADRWHNAWQPTVEEHLAWWGDFDLQGADTPALLAHLDETVQRIHQIEAIHFEVVMIVMIALDLFQKTIDDLFPEDDAIKVHTLLSGFEAKGAESSQALWALSRRALAEPTVRRLLADTPAAEVRERLADSEAGRAFLDAFNDFLQTYGYQSNKNYVSQPTLGEDPTFAIQSLQGYLGQPDRDLAAEAQAIVDRREQAVSAIREKLSMYPRPIVDQFEFLLKAAQEAAWLREEHAHQLDLPLNQRLRQVLLAIGRRLHEAGVLKRTEDVFYLTPDEIRVTVSTDPFIPRQELVRQRQAVKELYATITPPLMFGPLPTEPPPPHPIAEALMQNAGDPSQSSVTPGELKGVAGSSGRVRGPARILHSETEADRLHPGDILVTATTVPAWTPLFANIAGLVTATGGVLSHAAVVAREFGVPAVVGATAALSIIQDGQIIEVDGDAGVVYLA